jgi:hypothetical protein
MDENVRDGSPADDARPQDIELYAAMLTFTMQRIEIADEILSRKPSRAVDVEACAVQIRIALENIVMSTLIANRPAVAAVSNAFANKTAGDARRIVKSVNPNYWPTSFVFRREESKFDGDRWFMTEPEEPYLREEDWGKAYGFCSTLLHAVNPYQYLDESATPLRDQLSGHVATLKSYSKMIRTLLWRHQIHLTETNVTLICRIPNDLSERPTVEVYVRSRNDSQRLNQ